MTLGVAIGERFEKLAKRLFLKELEKLAGDYKEWVAPLIQYTCK